jgi:hypothetical protein
MQIVGDIPNRYTCDVVLDQQARVAMEVVWRIAYRAAQLLEGPWWYRRMQELMAVTLDRPKASYAL